MKHDHKAALEDLTNGTSKPDSKSGLVIGTYRKDTIETIRQAIEAYAAIEPLLRELIELQTKRIETAELYIDYKRLSKERGILDDSALHIGNCLRDAKTLAANTITAIKEILEKDETNE